MSTTREDMTPQARAEQVSRIQALVKRYENDPASMSYILGKTYMRYIRFLLDELAAADAREEQLRDTLREAASELQDKAHVLRCSDHWAKQVAYALDNLGAKLVDDYEPFMSEHLLKEQIDLIQETEGTSASSPASDEPWCQHKPHYKRAGQRVCFHCKSVLPDAVPSTAEERGK